MLTYPTSSGGYLLPLGHNDFYVISGSISHIQKFIYNTTSSGALRNLRGRSFYISLLGKAICNSLLQRLNLQQDSILYNSGGTFCIIAPYSPTIESDFSEESQRIKSAVAQMLNCDMVNICGTKASRTDLEGCCDKIFDQLFKQNHRLKFTPYGVDADYDMLFNVKESHKEPSYDNIGAILPDVTAILVCQTKLSLDGNVLYIGMPELGTHFYLGKAKEFVNVENKEAYLLLINDEPKPNTTLPIYREYMAGNGSRAKSFEELFTNEDSKHQRLAVLRMDVDNLGSLLRNTMTTKDPLAEFSQMSRRLDLYFKKRLNEMWFAKYSHSIVIIYAGGDDLFIVGEWEQTLSFMNEIQVELRPFFNNDSLSISGGISFIKPKYPIIRAAEMSADEEGLAKKFTFGSHAKSAISLFGTPMRWDCEYKRVQAYKDSLLMHIRREDVDKSLLSHILQIAENVTYENRQIRPIRYVWLAAYDLSRMAKKKRGGDNIGSLFIKQCVTDIVSGRTLGGEPIDSPYHSLQLITIAARLAQMTLWKESR